MRTICVITFMAAGLCFAGQDMSSRTVLKDLDGVPRRPLEPGDKTASVLIFYWQDCPISNGYAPELNRIAASHTNFAFYIVQVDPELTRADAKKHAREYDLHPIVLMDPQHQLVKYTHATVTPEAVVIGKGGQVLYRGRIDDGYAAFGKKRATTTEHDLNDALDALASGKPVKITETKAIGCTIQ